jgi:hypothetical protein
MHIPNLYTGLGVFGSEKAERPSVFFPPAPIYSKLRSSCESDDCKWSGEVRTNKPLHTNSWFRQWDICLIMSQSEFFVQGRLGLWTKETNPSDVERAGAQTSLSVEGPDSHRWDYAECTMLAQHTCEVCVCFYMKYMYLNVCKLNSEINFAHYSWDVITPMLILSESHSSTVPARTHTQALA